MSRRKPPPPIFFIVKARESVFREIADRLGLAYSASDGKPGITEFRCKAMDDSELLALINELPSDAHAYTAIVG